MARPKKISVKAKCHPDRTELRAGMCASCYVVGRRRLAPRDYMNLKLKKYGIDADDYDLLLWVQGGACAICQDTPADGRLSVDHCHETGVVRGLLCSPCNTALGMMKDDVERLRRAINYLDGSKEFLVVVPDMKWAATDSRVGIGKRGVPKTIIDAMSADLSVIWTPSDLARKTGGRYVTIANVLRKMFDAGVVERTSRGLYRLSSDWTRLA